MVDLASGMERAAAFPAPAVAGLKNEQTFFRARQEHYFFGQAHGIEWLAAGRRLLGYQLTCAVQT
jgi:hypothetical protein